MVYWGHPVRHLSDLHADILFFERRQSMQGEKRHIEVDFVNDGSNHAFCVGCFRQQTSLINMIRKWSRRGITSVLLKRRIVTDTIHDLCRYDRAVIFDVGKIDDVELEALCRHFEETDRDYWSSQEWEIFYLLKGQCCDGPMIKGKIMGVAVDWEVSIELANPEISTRTENRSFFPSFEGFPRWK